MYRFFFKNIVLGLSLMLWMAGACGTSAAQVNEDTETFRMYYEEKDLVISATRSLKPTSQTAENITLIRQKNIEEMNAHTVAEILKRETGLFVNLYHMDFASPSLIEIQGARARHVLVLLDGITWNSLSTGSAETLTIPVGIIDRIEIIKGPASSVWGSSIGGVVNIITKPTGTTKTPKGTVMASYGQKSIIDLRADMAGKAGAFGYYLYAGRQDSDPLVTGEPYTNNSFYSKIDVRLSKNVSLGATGGISTPEFGLGKGFTFSDQGFLDESRPLPVYQKVRANAYFLTAHGDVHLTKNLDLDISLNRFWDEYNPSYFFDETSELANHWLFFYPELSGNVGESYFNETSTKGIGKLVWSRDIHTVVMGIEFESENLEQLDQMEPPVSGDEQYYSRVQHSRQKEAIFINDTINLEKLSIIPGIRYDHDSLDNSFFSPSLGIVYRFTPSSVLRASAARGFTTPSFLFTYGDIWRVDGNSSLSPENVWSFQAGIETSAVKHLIIKAALFRHDLYDAFTPTPDDQGRVLFTNSGSSSSQGGELNLLTDPIYNLSLLTGLVYVNIDTSYESESPEFDPEDRLGLNIGIKYDDTKTFNALLFGHYEKGRIAINTNPDVTIEEINSFIWDLHINKKIYANHDIVAKLFLTAHNLFEGTQSYYETYHDDLTPERWVEAGITLKY